MKLEKELNEIQKKLSSIISKSKIIINSKDSPQIRAKQIQDKALECIDILKKIKDETR